MSLMREYIDKHYSADDYRAELARLISEYKKVSKHDLLVYVAAMEKGEFPILMDMTDSYIISDLLPKKKTRKSLDVYIETPGGSGEAAEVIADIFRSKYAEVNFIVSGEAKSAGTILALSGDNIVMTETGSLGPIDAQCSIGRKVVSAYDYLDWIHKKEKEPRLSPFDATMIAQISPGELMGVQNSLEYAKDLVIGWLPKYKFKKWTVTEERGLPVTSAMKEQRAKEIAEKLVDHAKWRSHGRSLKIKELNQIQLHIDKPKKTVLDLINRIQVVIRLLFSSSGAYKIFMTDEDKIIKSAASVSNPPQPIAQQMMAPPAQPFETICQKCGRHHKLYVKFIDDKQIDIELQRQGFSELAKDAKVHCACGQEIDLSGIKNDIEIQTGQKVI